MPALVRLHPISEQAAAAILAGQPPPNLHVAADYPTEFSLGVAEQVGRASLLGPFFILRAEDDLVIGEIGGGLVAPGEAEIGYAIVGSCWSHGYATAAVQALIARAGGVRDIKRLVAHTPLDRPASGRVLQKAGFTYAGETDDEHAGQPIRVSRWVLILKRGDGTG